MPSCRLVETVVMWADGSAETVAIRGTFGQDAKQWWTQDIPLRRVGDVYRVVLVLEPGRYEFKYVIDGGHWRVNSSMYEIADDGHGNSNNVLVVVPPAAPLKSQRESTYTALSIDDNDSQSMGCKMHKTGTHNHSEDARLLATGSDRAKSATAGYSAVQRPTHGDEDRSSHTADVGEDGRSLEADASSSDARPWSAKSIIVATLVLLLFGLLGAASALFYK
ncbi:hypothetical protein GGI20_004969 [Coemansia sp. BCRC 34301]|nr:hypothetical protein GGI20_004969 [Coemansia sp. BCRC 34301]